MSPFIQINYTHSVHVCVIVQPNHVEIGSIFSFVNSICEQICTFIFHLFTLCLLLTIMNNYLLKVMMLFIIFMDFIGVISLLVLIDFGCVFFKYGK